MKPFWTDDTSTIYCGKSQVILRMLPEKSVHCVVTSPPYWGLRDYGIEPVIWGGSDDCEHVWEDNRETDTRKYGAGLGQWQHIERGDTEAKKEHIKQSQGQFCRLCDAWEGALGLEPTPELYVEHLVKVFREVWRVLRDDGTCWINLGDSYAGNHSTYIGKDAKWQHGQNKRILTKRILNGPNLKPKNLCMIPARVALALQVDGWYLRSDIIWAKPNPIPESVIDRPTKSYEHIFLLTKKARYFYDQEAVRKKHANPDWIKKVLSNKCKRKIDIKIDSSRADSKTFAAGKSYSETINPSGRNLHNVWTIEEPSEMLFFVLHMLKDRSPNLFQEILKAWGKPKMIDVWTISTVSFSKAHFATFPPALVKPMILAGTSPKTCKICGAPWKRITIKGEPDEEWKQLSGADLKGEYSGTAQKDYGPAGAEDPSAVKKRILEGMRKHITTGWEPTCNHNDDKGKAIVLDLFSGSGTVAEAAQELGRAFVLIDIKEEYCQMSLDRISGAQIGLAY